jgi:hypothetical protein
MPVHYRPNCATCTLMKKDKEFKRRFYTSTYFDAQGRETLRQVSEAYHPFVSEDSIYNHARKHGTWSPRGTPRNGESINDFNTRSRETKKALSTLKKVAPEILLEGDIVDLTPKEDSWEDGLDELLKQGTQDLKSGKMKINASQYVTALKIKADREAAKGSGMSEFLSAMAAAATKGKPSAPAKD